MSAQQHIGRRLVRNKGALFGLIVIATALLVALIGYFIAPDSTPNANRMIVEIGGRRPGFHQQFLLLKKERTTQHPSLFNASYPVGRTSTIIFPSTATNNKKTASSSRNS